MFSIATIATPVETCVQHYYVFTMFERKGNTYTHPPYGRMWHAESSYQEYKAQEKQRY